MSSSYIRDPSQQQAHRVHLYELHRAIPNLADMWAFTWSLDISMFSFSHEWICHKRKWLDFYECPREVKRLPDNLSDKSTPLTTQPCHPDRSIVYFSAPVLQCLIYFLWLPCLHMLPYFACYWTKYWWIFYVIVPWYSINKRPQNEFYMQSHSL